MKALVFASRNRKELLRDPTTLVVGVGLPVVLLAMFSLMQRNIPFDLYRIDSLLPGVAVFSFSFVALFSGLLLGKDKSSSFLLRIFSSPLTAADYIVGYTLPLFLFAFIQSLVCFAAAFGFGLAFNGRAFVAFVALIPAAALYVGFGLLFGSAFTDRQVGGIFGVFVNVTTWLSGTFFDPSLLGGVYVRIANLLPFAHAVEAARAALSGEYAAILPHLAWVVGYGVLVYVGAILIFKKKMKA